MIAAKSGYFDIVKTLAETEQKLQTSIPVSQQPAGACALMFARYFGFNQICEYL